MMDVQKLRTLANDPRHLWIRYGLALFLIVGLLATTHYLKVSKLQTASRFAELINTSGQQRMLSQRILLFSGLVLTEQDPAGVAQLNQTILRFSENHTWLLRQGLVEDIIRPFMPSEKGRPLDLRIGVYLQQASALAAAVEFGAQEPAESLYATLLQDGMNDLLADLDEVVSIYEQLAKESATALSRMQGLALLSAIVLLVVEALLIFYPAHRGVRNALDQANRATEKLSLANRQLEAAAFQDDLTGIANRRGFFKHLNDHMADSLREGNSVILFAIDLDGFKPVNDTMGHKAGDAVLAASAHALKGAIGPADFVARMGGDEFAVVRFANKCADSSQRLFADRLVDAIATLEVSAGEGHTLGASVGVRCCRGTYVEPDRLVEDADLALYEAKRAGKNGSALFGIDFVDPVHETAGVRQPVVSIATGGRYGGRK